MKTHAAVLYGREQDWQIEEIDLDPPKDHEVLVRWEAAGLCHSDQHLRGSDIGAEPTRHPEQARRRPVPASSGATRAAGSSLEVGPGVRSVSRGRPRGGQLLPHLRALQDVHHRALQPLRHGRVDLLPRADLRRHHALPLRGRRPQCHGQGGHLRRARRGPRGLAGQGRQGPAPQRRGPGVVRGDDRMGLGRLPGRGQAGRHRGRGRRRAASGINAVQGAPMVGAKNIVAVDPVEFKQKSALDFGATHTAGSIEEAIPLVTDLTRGQMADAVILVPSVMYGDLMAGALAITGKNGTCVVTGVAPQAQTECSINLFELAMWQKEVRGVVFGAANPRFDIPNLLALYKAGQLKLDELITRTYPLDQINQGYQDMLDGVNIRGVSPSS